MVENQFVGLKSKMYSILDESNNEQSTNKGHNSFVVFQEFLDILFQKKIVRHAMRGIKSKNHNFVPIKLIKYPCHVLTIKDIFSKMELIH